MKNSTRKVWALESGFSTDNEKRDKWFAENPVFLVKHNKENQHLIFMPLAYAYTELYDRADQANQMTCWETTAAEEIERTQDGSYRCYKTASGTKYHLYLAGELKLGKDAE